MMRAVLLTLVSLTLASMMGCGGETGDGDGGDVPGMDAGRRDGGGTSDVDAGCERAVEICGDFMDQNCDGRDTSCGDTDGDGVQACRPGEAPPACDCNDAAASAYPPRTGLPGGVEQCDGLDNDCNGRFDESAMCCTACMALDDPARGDVCTAEGACDCSAEAGTAPCATGQTCCATGCVDLDSDTANCGFCGTQCSLSADRCTAGNCMCGTTAACDDNRACSGGACQ